MLFSPSRCLVLAITYITEIERIFRLSTPLELKSLRSMTGQIIFGNRQDGGMIIVALPVNRAHILRICGTSV